jgi:hypothetical protein
MLLLVDVCRHPESLIWDTTETHSTDRTSQISVSRRLTIFTSPAFYWFIFVIVRCMRDAWTTTEWKAIEDKKK